MINDNFLKESTKLIRKGCCRKNIQYLEKVKNSKPIDKKLEMEILRRQVYCLNKILESYLHRNISFYKKTALIVISKTKMFLQQWYELIRAQFKNKNPKIKMIQAFLYELLKYSQNIGLKYVREEEYELAYFFCQTSKQVLENINGFQLRIWETSTRDMWNELIIGLIYLQNQNFDLASKEFEGAINKIQKNILQIISMKIKKSLSKEIVKKYSQLQIIMLFHIFYLLSISYLYSDNLIKYQELLKLIIFFHRINQYNGEQSKILKDFIKQHHYKLQIYLKEQGEIQRIISFMYDVPEIKDEEKPNYIDEFFYQKYEIEQLNRQAFYKSNNSGFQVKKICSIIVKNKDFRRNSPSPIQAVQPQSHYYDTTININLKPSQQTSLHTTQISQRQHSQQSQRKSLKKESFSYIKSDRESMKYLDNQIQLSLKKESFYSYNELSKDMETNISVNSDDQKQLKSDRSNLKTKNSRQSKQEINQQTKMAIFNLIEAKSLYYIEVQKANSKLKNIKQIKDQQQKKMMSDKLISDMKLIQKQPSMFVSADLQEEKDELQIYKDVFNDLKKVADTYVMKMQEQDKSNVRQRIYTQPIQTQQTTNTVIQKCKDLSKSIQQQKEFF